MVQIEVFFTGYCRSTNVMYEELQGQLHIIELEYS